MLAGNEKHLLVKINEDVIVAVLVAIALEGAHPQVKQGNDRFQAVQLEKQIMD